MTESSASIPEPSLGSRIARGASAGFAINAASYGFLFLGQLLIARLLSQAEYAEFSVSISFIAIIALVADLGMNPIFTRLFAEADEKAHTHGTDCRGLLLGSGLTLRIGLSLVVVALAFLIAPALYPTSISHPILLLLPLLLISSRLLIVRSVGDSILRALGKYYLSALFGFFDAIAFALLMVFAMYRHLTLDHVVWIYVLCNLPGFILLIRSIAQWMKREHIALGVDLSTLRSMLHLSVPLALGTAFLTIHTQIDNLLLYRLSTPVEVSNYSATIRLSAAMSPFSLVLCAVTAPELTRLLHRRDYLRARRLTDTSLRLLLVAGAGIAIVFTFLATTIVPLLLGAKYSSASPLFVWTGWMIIPIFIATLLMDLCVAAGDSWFMTANTATGMVTVIIGDLLLIPGHGAMGAMASKLTAVALGAALIVWLSRKTHYLDAGRFVLATLWTGLAAGVAITIANILPVSRSSDMLAATVALSAYCIVIHFTHVLPLKEVMELVKRISSRRGNTGE
ncbi:MAG: oligosaccharide flippase family protein [Candidatus Kapaibacterium sp.]